MNIQYRVCLVISRSQCLLRTPEKSHSFLEKLPLTFDTSILATETVTWSVTKQQYHNIQQTLLLQLYSHLNTHRVHGMPES